MLKFWNSWYADKLILWSAEILKCQGDDIMKCWSAEMLKFWNVKTLMNKIYGLFNSFDCIILSKRITTKEFGTDCFAFLSSFFRD